MHDEYRKHIKHALVQGGIKIQYIQRTLLELDNHYEDLRAEARGAGLSAEDARSEAERRLGDPQVLVDNVLAQDTLKVATARWHWLDKAAQQLLLVMVLPVVPVLLCVGRGPVIAKWSLAITASAMLTIALLLALGVLLLG